MYENLIIYHGQPETLTNDYRRFQISFFMYFISERFHEKRNISYKDKRRKGIIIICILFIFVVVVRIHHCSGRYSIRIVELFFA